jgi:transposase
LYLLYLSHVNQTVSISEFEALKQENAKLRHELEQLKRLIFGSKSERFIPAQRPEQLTLGFDGTSAVQEAEAATEKISYTRQKRAHPGRTPLPDNLPTEDIIIEPQEDTSQMTLIGEEVTETIDYKPGVLLKRRYIRRKYARKNADGGQSPVVIGELPSRPIPKAIAEGGLLAHLFVSKYIDHLPFYRQIEMFKRNHGWVIQQSTLNDWFSACCTLLQPLYDRLIDLVMDTDYLQADESGIKVLEDAKNGKSHQGYMWVYRNPLSSLVLFDYRKGRGANGPKERLERFAGKLQCDGYRTYDSVTKKRADIELISCLAHIRRKFHDALNHHPELAQQALAQIQQLYAFERVYREKGLDAQQIAQRRQKEAKPVFEALSEWVVRQQANNLSKGPIGTALLYAKNQLPKLIAYLEDGRIEIDNNLIENAIRPLALGRKNYLFAGSHEGAHRAAMMYSFFATCKTRGINPYEWLKDVLERIGDHPINRVDELLPHLWTDAYQEG